MSGPVSTADASAGRTETGRPKPPCRTEAAKAVRRAARDAGSNRTLTEPVDTRALQINGCASRPDVHVRAAVKGGESSQRIAVPLACRDTGLSTPDERAAVVLAASLTALPTPVFRTGAMPKPSCI
jgi:AhpD family alkylhydroperoxidase